MDATYAFDAAYDKVFNFKYNGSQLRSNTLTIKNNETNETVYSATQTSMLLHHTVPGGTLVNGVLYNVLIYVTEINGTVSDVSAPIIFYCYSTPKFNLNVTDGQVIRSPSYDFEIDYNQTEGEEIQSFYIVLYDASQQILYTSSVRYDTTLPLTISNLEDNLHYYVRAFGETINHMILDTGYISISVKYIIPSMYSYLVAENDYKNGWIVLTPNITSIEGRTIDGSEPLYTNGCIDTKNGASIVFDEHFNIKNDFILHIVGTKCGQNNPYIILSNGETSITITERLNTFITNEKEEKMFYELRVNYLSTTLILFSDKINVPTDNQFLSLWIKRQNNMYELHGPDLYEKIDEINNTQIESEVI